MCKCVGCTCQHCPAGLCPCLPGPPCSGASCKPRCSHGLQVLTSKLWNAGFSTFFFFKVNLYNDVLTGCLADGSLSSCGVEVWTWLVTGGTGFCVDIWVAFYLFLLAVLTLAEVICDDEELTSGNPYSVRSLSRPLPLSVSFLFSYQNSCKPL